MINEKNNIVPTPSTPNQQTTKWEKTKLFVSKNIKDQAKKKKEINKKEI